VQVDQLDGRVAVRDAAQVAGDEVAPVRSHDGVVDSDERFGDPVGGAVAAECVGFVADQADVLEYVERRDPSTCGPGSRRCRRGTRCRR
jgi:hypothetical protein